METGLKSDSPEASGLAALPAGLVQAGLGARVSGDGGRTDVIDAGEALRRLAASPHLVCHRTFLVNRLAACARSAAGRRADAAQMAHFDVAELFTFVRPAQMALPSPGALAEACAVPRDAREGDLLRVIADTLLGDLSSPGYPHLREARQIASTLDSAGWPWGPYVLAALEANPHSRDGPDAGLGLNVWDRIEDWEDHGPVPPPGSRPVSREEAVGQLEAALGGGAELRESQRAYAGDVAGMFAAKERPGQGAVLLAEAGTGLGKTLGYLAPAKLWAARNKGSVWVSTYTKNLQRQLEQESMFLYPDPADRAGKAVIRKGRENYMCLLNFAERTGQLTRANRTGLTFAALIARWARYSRDGDMVGGDFPAWLIPLFVETGDGRAGPPATPMGLGLTDRRGECIYSACPHYRKCFIERAARRARRAEIVIANHAFVMAQTAVDRALASSRADRPAAAGETGEEETIGNGQRLVFDEGHHVFDAADNAFSAHLTVLETTEMRRWIRGPEGGRRRGRGLIDRAGDLVGEDKTAETSLQEAIRAAADLPGPGFMQRIEADAPANAGERFFALVRQQVLARTERQGSFSRETECHPLVDGAAEAAEAFGASIGAVAEPLKRLAAALLSRLDGEADELETAERVRIESVVRSLRRRSELTLTAWRGMLETLARDPDPDFVDWFAVEMNYGREFDTGMHRHWVDPSLPFAETILEEADGVLITSATLRDRPPDAPDDWQNAEARTGASHLALPVKRLSFTSPFDYGEQARILVVTDVDRNDSSQTAAAMRELFLAAGGGSLGLFTAIHRLRAAHEKLLAPLAEAGLPLFAQHIDPMDTGTLVDLFRAEKNACLLGTDAVRDGVDVPGDSLRLIVFDRVPWPKPTILERRRRERFGGARYQDMMTRLKLQQAFGRLIRRRTDRGVFVVLDSRLPTRLTTAFPDEVEVQRIGLVDAIEETRTFLQNRPC